MSIRVVDADDEHSRYVSLCTHIDEKGPVRMRAADMRLQWLKNQAKLGGMKTKVAIDENGKPLGFIHIVPIESPSSGMIGRDLMVIPCLTINYQLVYKRVHGTGVGKALVQACEQEAGKKDFKGLAIYAYSGDFWFMPSVFFQKLGFEKVPSASNIWVKKWAKIGDPTEPIVHYEYIPVSGKVVIDFFWSPYCLTVCVEVTNIREVASEFDERVVLREYRTDDPEIFARYGITRAIYINGKHKDWGYAAPKEELLKEIQRAFDAISKIL